MKMLKLTKAILLSLTMAAALTACNDNDNDNNNVSATAGTDTGAATDTSETSASAPLDLTILHINDHHSHLEASGADLILAGAETEVEMGGFPRVVSKIEALRSSKQNVLTLHAGDAITGTLYYTLFRGEADAEMMNQVCFDAFALGNHEFDDGDAGLKNFLSYLNGSSICETPVLAANVVPEVGVSALTPISATDYIQPYVIKEIDGQQVGIIGIDIASKTKNSSNPDETTEFLDEVTTAQRYIDELEALNINKIILMTHYQYANDLAMVPQLSGVDVIVGGDSHTLLGDSLADLGLSPAGEYPTQLNNADASPVCVVQAWQYSQVVGELNVSFDEAGNVTACAGTPHLLLGDTFVRDDVELAGAELTAVQDDIAATSALSIVAPDATTEALLTNYASQVEVLTTASIGTVAEDLCLVRFPGESRSQICEPENTASNGSDISNLVALAFKTMSNTSDIALQNGGGVRTDISAGDLTIGDAYTLLPFSNTLLEIDMTGEEIINTLEDALDYALDPEGSTGAFPYASGLRWAIDASMEKGSRFSNIEVKLKGDTDWSAIDPAASYKVVTNNFIAGGRDGYTTLGIIDDERKVDTFLDYAQSFVDYALSVGTINKLDLEDYSTQSYINADGVQQ